MDLSPERAVVLYSDRPGGFNASANFHITGDLYVTTRRKLHNGEADEEKSRHRRSPADNSD